MKTMKYFLPLSLALFLSGCSTTFRPWNLSDVHEGMEYSQVVKVLGDPDFTEQKDGTELLHYTYQEDYNPFLKTDSTSAMDNNRTFRDLDSDRAFKEYEYVVILADGKVINYKEL